jgi:hypothetical protein
LPEGSFEQRSSGVTASFLNCRGRCASAVSLPGGIADRGGEPLEARLIGYVLAVACDHRVPVGGEPCRADALAARVPARAWQCVSAGKGAKGHRWYDWAFLFVRVCG